VWFLASRFERLGRWIAAAPRAVLVALVVVTLAASPGVIQSDSSIWGSGGESLARARKADSLALDDVLLVELVCDEGLWSRDCLAAVASVTRTLAERRDLVARVDSLATRERVVWQDGRLALRPFLADLPGDPLALRRLRARAGADRALVRGVAASNERAALVQTKLVPGAPAREVAALVESLRSESLRTPSVSLTALSGGLRARELELAARRDLSRTTPLALGGLALLVALATGSVWLGLGVAALAGAALAWSAGALALGGVAPGSAAAVLPCVVAATSAGSGLALLHRVTAERRAGRELTSAVTRALGAAGAPLAAAGGVTAVAFAALGLAASEARPLALAVAVASGAAVASVALGLPAFLLVFARGGARRAEPTAPWAGFVDRSLARLDGASRAPRNALRIVGSLAFAALALLGVRMLRGDASAARFAPAPTPISDALEPLARDFGGTALVRVVVDSGAAGGVSDPAFLERVRDLQRRALQLPGVGSTRSLVDAAVVPAMRASHDDDPVFAVIPPTREQVDEAWALFAREAPERLRDGTDTERRRLAIDMLVDARDSDAMAALERELGAWAAVSFGRAESLRIEAPELRSARDGERLLSRAPLAASAAVACVALFAALAFESLAAGALAALPAAAGGLAVIGGMGWLGLPLDPLTSALAAFAAAGALGPALLYLARVRELAAAGADLHVAVSIALRDVGRPIADGALASLSFFALLASAVPPLRAFGVLACAALAVSAAAVLIALPTCIRTARPRFLIERPKRPTEATHSCVRVAERK